MQILSRCSVLARHPVVSLLQRRCNKIKLALKMDVFGPTNFDLSVHSTV
jgi:hypothetical protein